MSPDEYDKLQPFDNLVDDILFCLRSSDHGCSHYVGKSFDSMRAKHGDQVYRQALLRAKELYVIREGQYYGK